MEGKKQLPNSIEIREILKGSKWKDKTDLILTNLADAILDNEPSIEQYKKLKKTELQKKIDICKAILVIAEEERTDLIIKGATHKISIPFMLRYTLDALEYEFIHTIYNKETIKIAGTTWVDGFIKEHYKEEFEKVIYEYAQARKKGYADNHDIANLMTGMEDTIQNHSEDIINAFRNEYPDSIVVTEELVSSKLKDLEMEIKSYTQKGAPIKDWKLKLCLMCFMDANCNRDYRYIYKIVDKLGLIPPEMKLRWKKSGELCCEENYIKVSLRNIRW